MNSFKRVLLSVLLFAGIGGCAEMSKQQVGAGVGAVAGGVVGSRVAGSSNRVVGAVAGAAIGGLIGARVGKHLSEQDKKRAAEASTLTAQTGKPQQFRTTSGATVTTAPAPAPAKPAPTATPAQPTSPPSQSQTAAASPECRTIRQTIVLQNGTREEEDVRMCNGPDGWQPA